MNKMEMNEAVAKLKAITESHKDLKRKRNSSTSRTISDETYTTFVKALNSGIEVIKLIGTELKDTLGNDYSHLKEENVQSSISKELKDYIAANDIPEAEQLQINGSKIDEETYFWEIRLKSKAKPPKPFKTPKKETA